MKKLLIITTALVAFGAGPAHAGPAAAAIGAVASWVGSSIAAGGFLGAALRIGISVGTSLLASTLAGKKSSGTSGTNVSFDISFGDDAALTFIAGRYVTAGKRKYIGTWGKNHRYVTDVIEVSCLPHASLENIWVDDEIGTVLTETDTDGTGYTLGHPVTNYDDAGDDGTGHRIWVRWMDGTQTAADPMLVALFGDDSDHPWTSDMVGTGKSYAIVTTRYDEETLTSYPTYLFEPSPLPMYDPRKDGSTGGSGAHRWGDRSTYQATTNPAVIAYNIVRGIYYGSEWVFGGKNLAAWRLPRAEWVAAMNECDAAVSLDGGGTEPAYRCGAEISVDAAAADVLEEVGRAGNMRFAEVGGMLKPVVGLPGSSVFALTDGDIIITEGQSFAPFYPVSQTYNSLTATYPEPSEKWASKDAPEYQDTASITEDGDRYLPTSVTYGAAPFANQVQRLMRAQMRDYRRMRTHTFSLPPDAYALEPLDMVTWDSDRNGYEGKQFVVESVTKAVGMNVAVTLREVNPSDYDWSTDYQLPYTTVTPVNPIPVTQGISGWTAGAVTVTDSAGTGRLPAILVGCASGEVGIDRVRVQVRKVGDASATLDVIRSYDSPYSWTITGVAQATDYQVRGRLISKLTARAVWSDWITVTTPEISITLAQLSQDVLDRFDELTDWINGDDGLDDQVAALVAEAQDLTQQLVDETAARIAAVQATTDAIAAEQDARVEDTTLSASRFRAVLDQVEAIRDYAANIDYSAYSDRQELRREISATVSDVRATFSEQITTATSATAAIAQRVMTLEAETATVQASITEIDTARVDGDDALAQQLALLSVGTVNQFDQAAVWYFDSTTEGWTGSPSGPTVATSGYLRPAAASYIVSPSGLGIAAATYGQVRARVKRTGTPTWAGTLYYKTAGGSWILAATLAAPSWVDNVADLTFNAAWSGTVDQIRIDLTSGADASNYLDIDWIAIGRPAPGASSADLVTERTARIDGDEALASDITALSSQINDATTGLPAIATAVDALETRVTDNEDTLEIHSEAITDLTTSLGGKASTEAVSQLETEIEALGATTGTGGLRALAQYVTALRSDMAILSEEIADANYRALLGDAVGLQASASASQTLTEQITQTNSSLDVLAQSVTKLNATVPTLASASALDTLTSRVTVAEGEIDSLSEQITDLSAEVDGKASSSALSSLTSRVTSSESNITSLSNSLTALTTTVNGKASSSSVTSLTSRVTATENDIESISSDVTILQNTLDDKADASAVSALQSTVTSQGGTISTHTTQIANLQTAVNGKASSSALSTLSSRVDTTEDDIDSLSSALTSLTSTVNGKASSSALTALTTRVTTAEGDIDSMSDALTSLTSTVGNFSASGKFRISTEATPSGAQSRIGLYAAASNSESGGTHSASLFLEAVSDGTSRVLVNAERFAVLNGSTRVVPFIIDGNNTYIKSALIADASISNAKMTGPIYSDNFVSGSSGWRINRTGSAEFNDVTIRRQLAVASGSISVGDFDVGAGNTGEGSDSGSNQSWMTASKTIFLRSSGVAVSAWGGAKKTYIATAGMTGGVNALLGRDPDVYWGWDARVLPATRWTGNQSLRVVFTFWSRNVSSVSDCVINWKIYEVS